MRTSVPPSSWLDSQCPGSRIMTETGTYSRYRNRRENWSTEGVGGDVYSRTLSTSGEAMTWSCLNNGNDLKSRVYEPLSRHPSRGHFRLSRLSYYAQEHLCLSKHAYYSFDRSQVVETQNSIRCGRTTYTVSKVQCVIWNNWAKLFPENENWRTLSSSLKWAVTRSVCPQRVKYIIYTRKFFFFLPPLKFWSFSGKLKYLLV